MDTKHLHSFRDELSRIYSKSCETKDDGKALEMDEIISNQVGMSLFNQTSALGSLHTTWISDLTLSDELRTPYSALVTNGWEVLSPRLEDAFARRLCFRLHTDDGALICGNHKLVDETNQNGQEPEDTSGRQSVLNALADEAHEKLRGLGVPGLGRCAAVLYPLDATLPGPRPQRVRGTCHAVFCHGSDVTLVDFRCRRLALHATSDILRLSLYKALGLRVGLACPQRLHVASLTAYLEHERPRLRLWVYQLSKQMDDAVMSLDCLAQVSTLLKLHVTEVLT